MLPNQSLSVLSMSDFQKPSESHPISLQGAYRIQTNKQDSSQYSDASQKPFHTVHSDEAPLIACLSLLYDYL